MPHINYSVELDVEELSFSLARNVDNDDLIKFIKEIDLHVCDWEFTTKLHDYFAAEMKKMAGEEA